MAMKRAAAAAAAQPLWPVLAGAAIQNVTVDGTTSTQAVLTIHGSERGRLRGAGERIGHAAAAGA